MINRIWKKKATFQMRIDTVNARSTSVKVPNHMHNPDSFFCNGVELACLRFDHESGLDKAGDMEEEMAPLMSGECTKLRK